MKAGIVTRSDVEGAALAKLVFRQCGHSGVELLAVCCQHPRAFVANNVAVVARLVSSALKWRAFSEGNGLFVVILQYIGFFNP